MTKKNIGILLALAGLYLGVPVRAQVFKPVPGSVPGAASLPTIEINWDANPMEGLGSQMSSLAAPAAPPALDITSSPDAPGDAANSAREIDFTGFVPEFEGRSHEGVNLRGHLGSRQLGLHGDINRGVEVGISENETRLLSRSEMKSLRAALVAYYGPRGSLMVRTIDEFLARRRPAKG